MEFMTNLLLTIWNQIIMTNINNFGYVRRRILSFTYKNPFRKESWSVIWMPIVPIVALFFLAKTCVAPFTCCPIVSTTPKVPLKLQSVHFQNFLSIISSPNTSFKNQNMMTWCEMQKKNTWNLFFCSWKISFTFCNIFEHPIFFLLHGCLYLLLVFLSLLIALISLFWYNFKFFSRTLSSPLTLRDKWVFQFKRLNDGLILLSTPHGTQYIIHFPMVFSHD